MGNVNIYISFSPLFPVLAIMGRELVICTFQFYSKIGKSGLGGETSRRANSANIVMFSWRGHKACGNRPKPLNFNSIFS